jgi:uncharacterized membrane protein
LPADSGNGEGVLLDVSTNLFGIVVPSTDPFFLAVVGVHVLLGLACVLSGLVAMLSNKGRGRHSTFGTIYFWCMAGVFLTMAILAIMRWSEDAVLFGLGVLAFGLALVGRMAAPRWSLRIHAACMGGSYIVLLTAFYVDNGKNLPVWRDLPPVAYWTIPALVGLPLILWVLARHPLLRAAPPP